MRKINAIIAVIICLLLADHMIFGSMSLIGMNASVISVMAFALAGLTLVHVLISTIITIKAVKAGAKTKAAYPKENWQFWFRRISGAILLFLFLTHAYSMLKGSDGLPHIVHMGYFGGIISILLPLAVYSHLIVNIKPLLIALGFKVTKVKVFIIAAILTILCGFAVYAMVYKVSGEIAR